MTRTPCTVPEDRIIAYVAGDLTDGEELTLAEHLGTCEECCEQAAELTALRGALPVCCATAAVRWHSFPTPFGTMFVARTDRGLARLSWQKRDAQQGSWRAQRPDDFVAEMEERFPGQPVVQDADALADVERELEEYFAGARSRFDIPVDLSSVSEFERRVLESARAIPFGEVIPYTELARRISKPGAARAVGNALGHNPVAIVVPCHRVVRRDGSLGGYTGGVQYKKQLLTLEGRDDLLRAG
ncbi:MAG: methylated-DNA--[protein]-cysteine S-methyltransferase [Gemmatimonadetes bacterium]|nr:methylated-DNA--[protein]-cysteine S-methyltransferase [Gemmatimonadota bacterium]